jgi:putative colanic acid biosynthesis acetyltransferase WcaF
MIGSRSAESSGAPAREPINLTAAGAGEFERTRSRLVEALWMVVEYFVVSNPLQVSSRIRVLALRLFGARIGSNVIMRPRVRVKFPWNLRIGSNCWIGEEVWIHNQGQVTIEEHAVVSQGTFVTTGSHDIYRSMDLVIRPVNIRRGAWLTARCIVLPGVDVGANTIVTPGSVVHKSLPPDCICGGNPAQPIRRRWGEEA